MRVSRFGLLVSGFVLLFISACNQSSTEFQLPVTGGEPPHSVQPTEGPSPVPPDTPFLGFPSQTPANFTTDIRVNLPNLAGTFMVRAGTNLTITDIGNDGTVNTCTISSSGSIIRTPQVPVGQPSQTFSLARGTYKLNCGRPNANATITSE